MRDRGIVYVATKLDRYVEEAFLSAESAKRHAPGLHVTLFTDRPANALCALGVFDEVRPIESRSGFGLAWAEGQLDRIACLARSPYERTLHLDTDTRVFSGALAGLFQVLEDADAAMVEENPGFSYATKHTGRRMFNAGFILYRRGDLVAQWLREWEARVRRNFTLALEEPVPIVPELAHVGDADVRRLLLRMDQIALMELLSPEVNAPGLLLTTLDDTWNYRGTMPRRGPGGPAKIVHAEAFKATTRPDLLGLAWQALQAGSPERAQRLYDYVAGTLPAAPAARARWRFWKVAPAGAAREEWSSAPAMRVDLHLRHGQIREARAILETMTAPDERAAALVARARIAQMGGAVADAVDLASEAVALAPKSAYAGTVLGAALLAAERPVDALPPLRAAARSGRPQASFLLGRAWTELREYRRAAASYRAALAVEPGDAGSANNLIPALLGARRYRAALQQADAVLAQQPGHTAALAFKCVALRELGREAARRELLDYDRLLVRETVPPIKGFRDNAAFNRALAQALADDATLRFEPTGHTTQRGRQTADLSGSTVHALRELNALCLAAAARRIDGVAKRATHPFDASMPRVYRLYSWAVILGEGGHQTPHIHASAWLSGIYYVEVPDEVRRDDPERSGWLEFGPSEARWHRDASAVPVLQVFPEPGLLLTFPSYFWHHTRPLRSRGRRISFAFDIVPA